MQALLYKARKEAGLTQAELAKKIGISETAYRLKETDQNDFKLSEMFLIADILDKDISLIFTAKHHKT